MFHPPIVPVGDGTFEIRLDDQERDLLRTLTDQLRALLRTDSPVLRRLFPPPYGDDEERNQGYAALAGAELVERRLAALDRVTATLEATHLDGEALEAWMRSINDVRLVLGTILDITDDDAEPDVDEANAATWAAYEYLGYLLEGVVAALTA